MGRSQLRQLQHYTGQLAKDTAGQLKQLADAQVELIFYTELTCLTSFNV